MSDLERDGKGGVHLDGSIDVGVSRLEVIEGPSGRRRRTKAERARIAAESLVPEVSVADVARRHGTTQWQVYGKRRLGPLTGVIDNRLIHSAP
jgi:transposase